MTRISEIALSFDKNLIRELIGSDSTNRKQLDIACKLLGDVIQTRLTPRQKEVITMHYYQNYSRKEIAQILHLDYSAVCRTIRRAKVRIRKEMELCFKYLFIPQED